MGEVFLELCFWKIQMFQSWGERIEKPYPVSYGTVMKWSWSHRHNAQTTSLSLFLTEKAQLLINVHVVLHSWCEYAVTHNSLFQYKVWNRKRTFKLPKWEHDGFIRLLEMWGESAEIHKDQTSPSIKKVCIRNRKDQGGSNWESGYRCCCRNMHIRFSGHNNDTGSNCLSDQSDILKLQSPHLE